LATPTARAHAEAEKKAPPSCGNAKFAANLALALNTAPLVPLFPTEGEVLLEKYAVERVLGEGGMGAVLRAQHVLRRVPVALKFIHPNVLAIPGAVERFYNEAVAASRIANEHVVQILDVDRLPSGVPFIVMEFLQGRDLAGVLHEEPSHTLAVPRAVHIAIQTLRALSAAHRAGVVHRDMKPSNVFLVERDGDPDFVKLVDFGISKVRAESSENEASLTQVNSTLGTPLYMAPEQARSAREVDARSDIYSVAVMLYEMLSGRTPYVPETGELTEILYKLFTTEPPSLRELRPGLDTDLVAVVERAMRKDPAQRYESAAAFAADLAVFADERSVNELHRLRQAEIAGGGVGSELFDAARGSVQIRSAKNFTQQDRFNATQAGTHVRRIEPVVIGRGHTEQIPISDDLAAPTGQASAAVAASPVPKAVWVVAALAACALVAAVALRKGAPAASTQAPVPAATLPAALPPSVAPPARVAAEAVEPAPVDAGAPTPPPAAATTPSKAKAAAPPVKAQPAATTPSGKPKLNDLGILN
jgi:eukaryotic-like serine/threonine-protein kinase